MIGVSAVGMDVVVAFLIGWAVDKARRVARRVDEHADHALNAMVDRVWTILAAKLGENPWLTRLRSEAAESGEVSPEVRQESERVLRTAAEQDSRFADELRTAVADAMNYSVQRSSTPPADGDNSGTYVGSVIAGGSVTIKQKVVNLAKQHPSLFAVAAVVIVVLVVLGIYGAVGATVSATNSAEGGHDSSPESETKKSSAQAPTETQTTEPRMIKTVPVAAVEWPGQLAITPDGRKLLVTGGHAAFVLDAERLEIIKEHDRLSTSDNSVAGVAVTPDGRRAYFGCGDVVGNTQQQESVDAVVVMDTVSNEIIERIPVPRGGSNCEDVIAGSGGGQVYIGGAGATHISIIDTAENVEKGRIEVGDYYGGFAVTPDGNQIFVARSDDTLIVSSPTGDVRAVPGPTPDRIAVTPDGQYVYTANSDNTVSVVDASSLSVVATIPLPGRASGEIAVSPSGQQVCIINYQSESKPANVLVIDVKSSSVIATLALPLGDYHPSIAFSPDGTRAYIDSMGIGEVASISVIDTGQR